MNGWTICLFIAIGTVFMFVTGAKELAWTFLALGLLGLYLRHRVLRYEEAQHKALTEQIEADRAEWEKLSATPPPPAPLPTAHPFDREFS